MNEFEFGLLDEMESAIAELAGSNKTNAKLLEDAFFRVCTFIDGVQLGHKRLTLGLAETSNRGQLLHDVWSGRRWSWDAQNIAITSAAFAELLRDCGSGEEVGGNASGTPELGGNNHGE